MQKDLRFRAGDMVAIAGVLLLAGFLAFFLLVQPHQEQISAQIYQDGALVAELSLSADTSITVEGPFLNTITVENGTIRVSNSTCPGKDCVHTGRISHAGQSIFCLPNRLEIRLAGTDEVDIIAE